MNTIDAIRNTLWREIHARSFLVLAGPAAVIGGLLLPETSRMGWFPFVLVFLVPVLAIGLGGGGDARADRWWGGLGGSARPRVLTRVGFHLGLILLTTAAAVVGITGQLFDYTLSDGEVAVRDLAVFTVLLAACALYLSAATARLRVSGFATLAGPLWLGTLVVAGGWLDWQIGAWSVLEGAFLRLVLLVGLGVAALLWGEGRILRRRHGVALDLAPLAVVAVVSGLHAGWSGRPLMLPPELADVREDGQAALYSYTPALVFAPRRAWLWREGEWRQVGPAGTTDLALDETGSMAFLATDPMARRGEARLVLVTADGREQACAFEDAGPSGQDAWSFRADGGGVATRLVVAGKDGVAFATAEGGCGHEPGEPRETSLHRWEGEGAGARVVMGRDDGTGSDARGPLRSVGAVDIDGDNLVERGTGQRWPMPGERIEWSSPAAHVGDALRVFTWEGPIYDLGPEGERARHATTLLDRVGG